MAQENAIQEQHPSQKEEALEERENVQSSIKEVGDASKPVGERHDLITPNKEAEEKPTNKTTHSRSPKGQGKGKKEASTSPKHVVQTWVRKEKDVKEPGAISTVSNASKQSSTTSRTKKGSSTGKGNEVEKNTQHGSSSSYTIGGNVRTRRAVDNLPTYDINFKCVERAEKRKEFYSKLEEKLHAMEVEKANLEAKEQEAKEAEMKLLRKGLKFKATPMPTFYHEPPPKLELKKKPTTRPKSPKFGRQKSVPSQTSEKTSSRNGQSGWSSTDEKALARGSTTPQRTKKPLQKSATQPPSKTSSVANETEDAASSYVSDNNSIDQTNNEPSDKESNQENRPSLDDEQEEKTE